VLVLAKPVLLGWVVEMLVVVAGEDAVVLLMLEVVDVGPGDSTELPPAYVCCTCTRVSQPADTHHTHTHTQPTHIHKH
jgi:hypothetical protein